ncbi:fasciclin domain-containing protein [Mucilaginibacter galii]|uniref:Fasciclin n=1 Tax=Mucilaginibacter galii TaxID=2005073 RepID=A0A917JBQ6_9SPHI|nr:fasciclin domain-containing protein [Mucilaginibacter galii]GGI51540.1 fasciclin [Mucilaginibacter galii]
MKNIFSIFLVLACFTVAKAQNVTPPRGSSFQDSVRSENSDGGKVILVNGEAMNTAKDFIENLTSSKTHTIFLASLRAASLVGTFKSRGPLTVFVPSDTAFTQKLGKKLDTLTKPAHKYELINLLSYHAVPGNYTAKELNKLIKDGKGEAALLTLSGSKLIARIDENRNIVLYDENGGKSVVSQFDIKQSNGTMHYTTQVLIPKDRAL